MVVWFGWEVVGEEGGGKGEKGGREGRERREGEGEGGNWRLTQFVGNHGTGDSTDGETAGGTEQHATAAALLLLPVLGVGVTRLLAGIALAVGAGMAAVAGLGGTVAGGTIRRRGTIRRVTTGS